jgi:hypothetical protein
LSFRRMKRLKIVPCSFHRNGDNTICFTFSQYKADSSS